jgi:hypothetical protein
MSEKVIEVKFNFGIELSIHQMNTNKFSKVKPNSDIVKAFEMYQKTKK